MEMRDEVFSSVGAQNLDTSSYQVFNLEDIEFNWEDSLWARDAVFTQGIDTPCSPTTFDDLSMGGSIETRIVLDEEEDKENSPPAPSTPESVRLTEPPRPQRNRPFGTRTEKVPDYVYGIYCVSINRNFNFCVYRNFNKYYCVCVLVKFIINVFHFTLTFFKN